MARDQVFDTLRSVQAPRVLLLSHAPAQLRAVLALDDFTLGPPVGGTRVASYPSDRAAIADACRLARAMTLKCSLAGLDHGGAKLVVMVHPRMDRDLAFRWLGEEIDRLGFFHTAGDLGTTRGNLMRMAEAAPDRVHTDTGALNRGTAEGVMHALRALADHKGKPLEDCTVAVQGCGAIGGALGNLLSDEGCELLVADTEPSRARALAEETGGQLIPAHECFTAPVDIVAPCAAGGAITVRAVKEMRCWGICGAANNPFADRDAVEALHRRGVLHVPSIVASAGGVVVGKGDIAQLPQIGRLTAQVLSEAASQRRPEVDVAEEWAWERIELARG